MYRAANPSLVNGRGYPDSEQVSSSIIKRVPRLFNAVYTTPDGAQVLKAVLFVASCVGCLFQQHSVGYLTSKSQ